MDLKLYKKLLDFRSYSKSTTQREFRDWLENYIKTNYQNVISNIDTYGNLYVTKGDAEVVNCVIGHLDINQKMVVDPQVVIKDDWIFGWDGSLGRQCGVGHDDKAGVYFCLQALDKFDNIKAFFPLDEEVGCLGTNQCDVSFFSNVGFMVQLDRRGNNDISQYTNGVDVVDSATKKLLRDCMKKFKYKWQDCMFTDVGELVDILEIQGVNISCGYYNEHSSDEVLRISEYDNAERFALEVLKVMEGKIHKIKPTKYYSYPKAGYSSRGWSEYDDFYDEYPLEAESEYFDSMLNLDDDQLYLKYKAEIDHLIKNTLKPSKVIITLIDKYIQDITTAEYYYQVVYFKTTEMLEQYREKMVEWALYEATEETDDLKF